MQRSLLCFIMFQFLKGNSPKHNQSFRINHSNKQQIQAQQALVISQSLKHVNISEDNA